MQTKNFIHDNFADLRNYVEMCLNDDDLVKIAEDKLGRIPKREKDIIPIFIEFANSIKKSGQSLHVDWDSYFAGSESKDNFIPLKKV